MTPTVAHCVCSLPPEGAAAPCDPAKPGAWPLLSGEKTRTVARCVCSLPPRALLRLWPGKAGCVALA